MTDFTRSDFDRHTRELKLPRAQQTLLDALVAISPTNQLPAADAEDLRKALEERTGLDIPPATLRQQRKRLDEALAAREMPFSVSTRNGRVVVHANKRWDADAITDSVKQSLIAHSQGHLRADFEGFVTPRGRPEELTVFFSYGWLDTIPAQHRVQDKLYEHLKAELGRPPEHYAHLPRIVLWRDAESIKNDKAGTPQMDAACEAAFMGLLVVSSKYRHSEACQREAGYFLDEEGNNRPGKHCMVVRFNLPHTDIPKRFKAHSRICLNGPNDKDFLTFWVRADAAARHKWIRDLADKIFASAAEMLGDATPPPGGGRHTSREDQIKYHFHKAGDRLHDEDHSATPYAAPSSGQPLDGENAAHDGKGTDIVAHLAAWAGSRDCKRPRLAALLGDFGMGKTVTCQLLTRRLLEAAKTKVDPPAPFPIYFDLRDVDRPDRAEDLTLEAMLDQMLAKAGENPPSAAEVIKFARAQHSVVIFDGLDEITNKVSTERAKAIYRQLLTIVPAELWASDRRSARKGTEVECGPSILVSCRSQYFADFASQRAFLNDSDRSGIPESSVYVMLPFTRAQVEQFLEKNLPAEDRQRCLDLLDSTGELNDLAKRPILLSYIGAMVDRLEREKAEGRPINLARLYDILIDQTFRRDDPKHTLRIQDKKKLLEGLALYLHRRGQDQISSERLTEWLDIEIAKHPVLSRVVASADGLSQSQIFAQDLRNATLLSRPGDDGFQFSHTSLREYFLARALYRAVLDGCAEKVWNLPKISRETLTFLVQHHMVEETVERASFERDFPALLAPRQLQEIRAAAFALWRIAFELRQNLPRPSQMDLSRLDLRDLTLKNLALTNIDFAGANLLGSDFKLVSFVGCNFAETNLADTRFDRCTFTACTGKAAEQALIRVNVETSDTGGTVALFADEAWHCFNPYTEVSFVALPTNVRARIASHAGSAFALTCSPDGSKLATGSVDGTARLWDMANGAELRRFEGHEDAINALAFSPDGTMLATGADDGTVRLWCTATGAELRLYEGHSDRIYALAFSPCGTKFATGSKDETVRIWDLTSNTEARRLEEPGKEINALAFSPAGVTLAVGSDSQTASLWDLASGSELRRFEGHTSGLTALAFSPDGTKLASGSFDQTARLWDVATGAQLRCFDGHRSWVRAIALSPDGTRLATGTNDGSAQTWDVTSGAELRRFEARGDWSITVALSPDGTVLVTSAILGAIRLWDADTGAELRRFESHGYWTRDLALSPDGTKLATGSNDRTLRIWDIASGTELRRFEGHTDWVNTLAFSPDGTKLATGSADQTARLWDVGSGVELRRFEGHSDWVNTLAFSHDGTKLATGSADQTARLWDVNSGFELDCFGGLEDRISSLVFSSDDKLLAVNSTGGSSRLWDVEIGAELDCPKQPEWARDIHKRLVQGSFFVVGKGSAFAIHDAKTNAHIRTILPLAEGWAHLDEDGNVIRMTPDGWKYVHGLKTEEDGSVSVVNVWDYLPDQGAEAPVA